MSGARTILYVQEVVTHSKLLHKMSHFLDIQYNRIPRSRVGMGKILNIISGRMDIHENIRSGYGFPAGRIPDMDTGYRKKGRISDLSLSGYCFLLRGISYSKQQLQDALMNFTARLPMFLLYV